MSRSPRAVEAPFTRYQLLAVAVCIILNMLDGFDVLAMSFAASGVKAGWHLQDAQLGVLLSAGLVGMCLGSTVLGICADRWGRRRIVLLCVALAGCGMLGSAAAGDYIQLVVLRVITGVGIGGTIASVAVLVSEYAPERWRSAALAAYATGYPVGATVGGALTALAIPHYGWRSAFAIGGAMSLAILPIAWFRLPESLDFLLTRRPPGALQRINVLLRHLGQRALDALPEPVKSASAPAGEGRPGARLEVLLSRQNLLVWLAFFSTMLGFYFITSWTPRLLNAAGLSESQGLAGGVLLNLGGIAGCALFAVVAVRADARRLLMGSLLVAALGVAIFGFSLSHLETALAIALLVGVVSNAAMSGLYAVGPPLYPAFVRATGMGWAIGIGRLGAILAPLGSGVLLEHGWSPQRLYTLDAVAFLVAAAATMAAKPKAS